MSETLTLMYWAMGPRMWSELRLDLLIALTARMTSPDQETPIEEKERRNILPKRERERERRGQPTLRETKKKKKKILFFFFFSPLFP